MKLTIPLTKPQIVAAEDRLSIMYEDDNATRDYLDSQGVRPAGMDDDAFQQWIDDNYVNAVSLDEHGLVIDTTKAAWRQAALGLVDDLENWITAGGLADQLEGGGMYRMQALGLRKAALSVCAKIEKAVRS